MELPKKLGISGGVMFFMGIIIGWVAFPPILRSQVHGQTELSKKGTMRPMWANLPFPWQFRVYLFNVTNPEGIEKGEKPVLEEVGPYYYDEWKENVNLVDNDEDDTIEFNHRDTFHFNPARSNGLTGDEVLIYPHLAMLSAVLLTAAQKPSMMGVTSKAVDSIYRKPSSIFVKATAKQIIFEGLTIDCTVKDFAGSAVCALMKTAKSLTHAGEDMYKVSLFGTKNGTVSSARTKILRGMKSPDDLGRVLEWNNQSALTVWPEDHCNAYNGTEGTLFHSFFRQDQDVVSFAPDICRSLSLRFEAPTKAYGFKTNHYSADLGDQSSVPSEKCFCPTPETCLKKGAMDLTTCTDNPIVATLPHFYLTDQSYMDSVIGMHPDKKYHELYVNLEPMTGTPLEFRITLQINMFIFPIEKFKLMKNFPNALLPLFWFEESIEMSDDVISQLKMAFILITLVSCLKWIMLVLGLGLGGAAGILEYKRRSTENKLEVTPVSPAVPAINSAKNSAGEVQKWPLNISTLQPNVVPPSVDRN